MRARPRPLRNNEHGQAGQGDNEDRGDAPGELGEALPAIDLGIGTYATALACGANHTCAIMQPGSRLKCWG